MYKFIIIIDMKAFWLMIIELYPKQLLFAKLGKMGGEFWFSEFGPHIRILL